MTAELGNLADALLAGGAIQLLVGLGILRLALGLSDFVVGLAVAAIAIGVALSANPELHRQPGPPQTIEGVLRDRWEGIAKERAPKRVMTAAKSTDAVANKDDSSLGGANDARADPRTLRAEVAMSDLKAGLLWGLKILIPFILIDLLVAHCLALLQWQTIAAQTLAIPLKLIVFLGIGGWEQLANWIASAAGAAASGKLG